MQVTVHSARRLQPRPPQGIDTSGRRTSLMAMTRAACGVRRSILLASKRGPGSRPNEAAVARQTRRFKIVLEHGIHRARKKGNDAGLCRARHVTPVISRPGRGRPHSIVTPSPVIVPFAGRRSWRWHGQDGTERGAGRRGHEDKGGAVIRSRDYGGESSGGRDKNGSNSIRIKKVYVYSDDRVAVQTLLDERVARGVVDDFLKKDGGRAVRIEWVPAHKGIQGNVEADKKAKEGSRK
ncbi:hypothetical protein OF83DRAFT_1088954 [Amylostereum chailletii]|nr:hypothetical protein OF83DRAFT_1088954 [Amylostereum chailletii]